MQYQIRYGKLRYISFLLFDLMALIGANILAAHIYLGPRHRRYVFEDYQSIIIYMVVIDILVTIVFNVLDRVYRRSLRNELITSAKHIMISFVILAVVLFTTKEGADYSRVTVYLAYTIYFVFLIALHIGWRALLKFCSAKHKKPTALLMTTDRFVDEGLEELEKLNIKVRNIYLLKNLNTDTIKEIPVVKTWEEAAAAICWKWIDKVYIYGLDHQMVPGYLVKACKDMGIGFDLVDFNYRIIDVTTIQNKDPKYGALSFLEGKRDIPFPIRRVYWITETEADLHRGFHAHKLNCQLLYCPYGKIDIILDDGQQRTTVTLDRPGKGLILMPGLWREMVWQQTGSVLCVLASEYYDADEYIRNYDEFIAYNKKYRESADVLR